MLFLSSLISAFVFYFFVEDVDLLFKSVLIVGCHRSLFPLGAFPDFELDFNHCHVFLR